MGKRRQTDNKKRKRNRISFCLLICAVVVFFVGCGDRAEDKTEEGSGTADLFHSQKVVIEMLSEGRGLSGEEHDAFLKKCGFEGEAPFYEYTYPDGEPEVELYYDAEREIGCGFHYWENAEGPVVCGYAFRCSGELGWCKPDPFACVSAYGTTGKDEVVEYREDYEYDEEGRLISYVSEGKAWEDEPSETMLRISFLYDEEGRLRERKYSHNTAGAYPFASFLASQHSYYDEKQRLLYTYSYTTSGWLDSYFIYEGDDTTPAYYFELNNQYSSYPVFYKIRKSEYTWEDIQQRNWTWATLEQELREGYISEEEFMSEQEWLEYQGFAGKEPFYRFDFSTEYNDYELIFYCAEDRESGGGILKRKGSYTQKWAFTFRGSEKYLPYPVTPFSVYAEYSSGKETFFLHGETIVEHFEKRNADSGEEFARFGYSEDGRLQYMIEDRPHGGVWRFYLYDGKADAASQPDYVLELDPGWGAAFYRFDG